MRCTGAAVLKMQPYEFINKEWIVSPTARTVYRTAALASLVLFWPLFAAIRGTFNPFLKLVLLVSLLAAATNQLGMEYFLFRFDESHPLKQIFWFCLMLFFPIGSALFCFVVYLRSNVLKRSCANYQNELSR